jgi:methionine aminopeptidase
VRDRPLIRTADEIARIRAAALVVHDVLAEIERLVAPGLTTADIDRLARRGPRGGQAGSRTGGLVAEGRANPCS